MSFASTPDSVATNLVETTPPYEVAASAEGSKLIKEFSMIVRQVDLSATELETKVALLLDNVTSAKATRDCMEALGSSQTLMKQAKAVHRKVSIWLAGGVSVNPQLKLQKERIFATFEANITRFNELSRRVREIVSNHSDPSQHLLQHSDSTVSSSVAFGSPAACTTAASSPNVIVSAAAIPTFGDARESLHGLRKVNSNIEATKQIFDELGSLVRQQAPHLDTLENAAATSKDYTRHATEEIHKAYVANRKRARRKWICILILTCCLCVIFWVHATAPTTPPRDISQLDAANPNSLRGAGAAVDLANQPGDINLPNRISSLNNGKAADDSTLKILPTAKSIQRSNHMGTK